MGGDPLDRDEAGVHGRDVTQVGVKGRSLRNDTSDQGSRKAADGREQRRREREMFGALKTRPRAQGRDAGRDHAFVVPPPTGCEPGGASCGRDSGPRECTRSVVPSTG